MTSGALKDRKCLAAFCGPEIASSTSVHALVRFPFSFPLAYLQKQTPTGGPEADKGQTPSVPTPIRYSALALPREPYLATPDSRSMLGEIHGPLHGSDGPKLLHR